MNRARAALALIAVAVVGLVLVSGGSGADPRTPAALPGLPPPFLGTTVLGSGELTAAVDAYGDVVDLRPSPAGPALIANPSDRQAAGTVPVDTGIVPRLRLAGEEEMPFWRADSVRQRYLAGANVVVTTARFGSERATVRSAAVGKTLVLAASPGVSFAVNLLGDTPLLTGKQAPRLLRRAAEEDREWLGRARPLAAGAPGWARRLYGRSLLTLRALTDAHSGALAAGARDGWAYVWPRDAATAALAFDAAGYSGEARRVARFLTGLDLGAAARFDAGGEPVSGRGPQGDAHGWVALAADATGITDRTAIGTAADGVDTPDYQEGGAGDYLGNAIADRGGGILARFGSADGLVRQADDLSSGLDSAAAWAVRPFAQPGLFGAARKTLNHLLAAGTPFGITPGAGWSGGEDPWSAPTAWSAWSLAALGERGRALRLLADLRRAATPAGDLPERVDARTGVPRSTTPLAWSHAFAILALREVWPSR